MATWCAWCGRRLKEEPHDIDTHGICPACKEELIRSLNDAYESGKKELFLKRARRFLAAVGGRKE